MNRGLVHQFRIFDKYPSNILNLIYWLVSLRRLQEYIVLLVNIVCRHHQEHTEVWNKCANAKYATSDQVQEFSDIAGQLVFIMEILEKNDSEKIQKQAIGKILAIATTNQSHL
jgi:hypothetical protein